ncbi:Sodium/hydrogen exchanger family-domain-containing protein [Talaromyces proteolyticus]|uniref:Sodium/hydrogen exchanger family-domain-containing protein n=1 Tax=Talaromyces proteolyticus TaxID=1131652 RepID=A0AAD4Q653_9EURO|nr:Sodium/hydrogen exchanger family-domain-containing protein [Talaromyces proteolyticus]KAH8705012.1 Sodium/hydrogen exchanger family-domain-containing protein [Talaromyces proteolyticus]
MLKPILDIDNLNISLSVFGIFVLIYGYLSAKIQQNWYLGEALPAFILGIVFGPSASNFMNVLDWDGDGVYHSTHELAYNLSRIVIGIQLVKVGYELPKQYQKQRGVEMTICLFPVMAMMWLCTTGCIKLIVPKVSLVSSLIIASCVTCTDPVLSQAIAKGPFAETYVRRPLREFISSEAGGNDGFGFPILLFAVALLRYAGTRENAVSLDDMDHAEGIPDQLGAGEHGRYGGGLETALKHWAIEGVLFMVLLGFAYGVILGWVCRVLLNRALARKWVDNESYLLFPFAMGLFIVGTCGCFGADETLACFAAGNALNWDGRFLAEVHLRHDSFNNTLERFLNFAAFMFIGLVMPWHELMLPAKVSVHGLTAWRLFALAGLVLLLRRIPAILLAYRFMPNVCRDWKEALFMGYFGPIGIGSVCYVEYAKNLFPSPGQSDEEINNLTEVMVPVVYWLVFFSIIVHGLSVPVLQAIYKYCKVPPIHDHPVEVLLLSNNEPLPTNSTACPQRHTAMLNNRFSRQDEENDEMTNTHRRCTSSEQGSDESVMLDNSNNNNNNERRSVSSMSPTDSMPSVAPMRLMHHMV